MNTVASARRAGRRRPLLRSSAGLATVTVLLLLALALATVLAMAGTSITQIRLSNRVQMKAVGQSVAEAGVDDLAAKFAANPDGFGPTGTQPGGNGQTFQDFGPTVLYENQAAGTGAIGQYRARVLCIDDGIRPIPLTRRIVVFPQAAGSGAAIGSAGMPAAKLGIDKVVADLVIKKTPLGNGALMASDDISIGGTATVNSLQSFPTDPPHVADVVANGNVSMGGSSYVDGKLAAAGTVTGQAYYPSVSGTYPQDYPNQATTEQWRLDYLAKAQTGTKYNNGVKGSATITAPAYIKGGISLQNSEAVTIAPNPSLSPAQNVVYVDGDVKLSGQSTLKNGVLLVVAGTFDQGGGTVYRVYTQPELALLTGKADWPTPTQMVYNVLNGSPIDSTSISLTGVGENIQEGIVYAVNGDIKLAGGTNFNGALVAGGTNGSINVQGNYTQFYPTGMHSLVEFYTGVEVKAVAEQP